MAVKYYQANKNVYRKDPTTGKVISSAKGTTGTTSGKTTTTNKTSGSAIAYDNNNLSSSQAKAIQDAQTKWQLAYKVNDKAGMDAAHAEAEAIRNAAGYKSDLSGNYVGAYPPPSNSGNSPYTNNNYTPVGTYNDANLPPEAKQQIEMWQKMYNSAMASGNISEANRAHNEAEKIRAGYGYLGGVDGSDYFGLNYPQNDFEYDIPQPTYESKYDPRIDALLNEILTREDFSYNAVNDPLYQQYAEMYRREGDRAMQETLAEAAAGAGGMNTYAITAAQQAANRYASQLNDKIPELYQLAYDMYLADKESKVQDLGILQNMDATQYGRYRDTMNDWKDDRNFAYGAYQDAVQQGNWQKTFDYNAMINDRDFNYNDIWRNKEWNAQQEDKTLNNSRYDQETAKEEVWRLIELGVTPSAELIARSGMSQTDIALAVEAVKAAQVKKGTSSGGSKKNSDYNDDYIDEEGTQVEPVGNGVLGLGLGNVSKDVVADLIKAGGVEVDENGNYYWVGGWNAQNYESKLRPIKLSNPLFFNV